jgi:hypothetical protein
MLPPREYAMPFGSRLGSSQEFIYLCQPNVFSLRGHCVPSFFPHFTNCYALGNVRMPLDQEDVQYEMPIGSDARSMPQAAREKNQMVRTLYWLLIWTVIR